VNTELRFLNTAYFFDYFDFVSFDRGYGSILSIIQNLKTWPPETGEKIYKTMYRFKGSVISGIDEPSGEAEIENKAALEDEAVRAVFPDYSKVDFNRYLYPVDDVNPMHRLWSDGHWLKAYLAYGCYWHSCAFCDVKLDYIKNFIPVDTQALFSYF
jgi:hypothetical protein